MTGLGWPLAYAAEAARKQGWHSEMPAFPGHTALRKGVRLVILSDAEQDGVWWRHASISRRDKMPTYDDLVTLHQLAWRGEGHAYQCFVPPAEHVNLHAWCLHLWGRVDGARALPDFAEGGSI